MHLSLSVVLATNAFAAVMAFVAAAAIYTISACLGDRRDAQTAHQRGSAIAWSLLFAGMAVGCLTIAAVIVLMSPAGVFYSSAAVSATIPTCLSGLIAAMGLMGSAGICGLISEWRPDVALPRH